MVYVCFFFKLNLMFLVAVPEINSICTQFQQWKPPPSLLYCVAIACPFLIDLPGLITVHSMFVYLCSILFIKTF